MKSKCFYCFLFLIFLGFQDCCEGRWLLASPKPDRNNAAGYARWLVSQSSWGILSTISMELGGSPFGNVVSFSDGVVDKSTGIPYFYLTTLDPTARNALKDHRSSLTISENPLGTCGNANREPCLCKNHTHRKVGTA
ncbi:hypothetical protein E1A91_D04G059700v1 [Gossypium mustelinum]|uniref:CREG-like beta-barrel domain-containing protein n=1 Tax=Gossypium mustelinum TaxID=34275 RepID=A0A5D2VAG8_GOSMU|nr:hypothetical protein E1A91_D04G059700v1 [Gossypium mustelinum]